MTGLAGAARLFLEHGLTVLLQSSLVLALGLLIGWRWRQQGPNFVSFVSRGTQLSVMFLLLFAVTRQESPTALFSFHLPTVSAPKAITAQSTSLPTSDTLPMAPKPGTLIWRAERPVHPPVAYKMQLKAPDMLPFVTPIIPKQSLPLASPVQNTTLPIAAWVEIGLGSAWLLGTLCFLARLSLGQIILWKISRMSRPADPIIQQMLSDLCRKHRIQPPSIRISPRVHSPFLAGSLRPVIYLPDSTFDPQILRAVLTHELAHRTRQDCTWNLFGQILAALLWPQPLLWLLLHRTAQSSEEACDLAVLNQDYTPAAYAALLLDLAERFTPQQRPPTFGAGLVPHQSALGRRIQTILDRRFTMMTFAPKTRFGLTAVLAASAFSSLFLVSTHAASPIHFSIFSSQKEMADKSMNNMHQMILGVQQYAQDYDNNYPPARKWGTVIAPYLRPKDVAGFSPIEHSKELHHDPLAPETQAFGYAFNQGLGSKGTARLLSPSTTVALFETTQDNFNATDLGQSVARPGRINGGNYYAYADGHIQWISDNYAPSFKPNLSPHSIRPRPSNIALQADQGDQNKQAQIDAEIAKRQADVAAAQAAKDAAQAKSDLAVELQAQQQALAEKNQAMVDAQTALIAAQKALAKADIQKSLKDSKLSQQQIALLDARKSLDIATLQQQIAALPAAKLDTSKDLRLQGQDLQYQILASRADAALNAAQGQQLAAKLNALQAQGNASDITLQSPSADQIKQLQDMQDYWKKNQDTSKKQYDALMKQYGKADLFSGKWPSGQDGTKKNYDALMKQYYGADVFSGKWPSGQDMSQQKYNALIKQLYSSGAIPWDLQNRLSGDLTLGQTTDQKAEIDRLLQLIQVQRQQLFLEQEELERLRQAQSASGTK